MGFSSDREFAVYKTLETKLDNANDITGQIFNGIQEELSITDWQEKGEQKKINEGRQGPVVGLNG